MLLIQAHRQVKLSTLASLFPQAITYESRKRNLQRFLVGGNLCVKLLWFPLIKYWIRQQRTGHKLNREQRRYFDKKKHQKYGYWMVALDRTLLDWAECIYGDIGMGYLAGLQKRLGCR
ncbi:hypothetical protein A6769_39115 [Nostoc punctiforme NIES-2108]|uniref:Uncharacterized protein n=1 Tax=Nostoc punctiforme NIES-2108 TaxID=1356359 RepID=A0A367RWL3_NOSPU|nr:hypothetical protein A6769_39115 [Nostoc punctiforme NIES-2108]